MRTSRTSRSKYFKLFLVFLVFESASSSQAATATINQLESPTPAAQIERPLSQKAAPQSEINQQSSLLVDIGKTREAEGDASSSASTNRWQLVGPTMMRPTDWLSVVKHQKPDRTASPSVTSVHQVWTASSSGRLDELSPEVISKLRNDVPFLAAYALRPRIVGAPEQQSLTAAGGAAGDILLPVDSYTTSSSQLQAPATNSAIESTTELNLQASSPQRSQSLLSSLGAFNEFNVEILSTSKSEHRHSRKTILKKDRGEDKLSQLKRGLSAANGSTLLKPKSTSRRWRGNNSNISKASQARSRSSARTNSHRQKKPKGKIGERGSTKGWSQGSQLAISSRQKRRKSANSNASIIKAGRYYQEQTNGGPANRPGVGSNGLSVGTSSVGDQTTTLAASTKGGGDVGVGDVKGSKTANMRPFYSRAKPSVETSGDAPATKPDNTLADDNGVGGEAADENSEEGELDDSPTSKRVGDDDVEEGGDTVTVKPKFDGVDDDPELPTDGEGAPNEDDDETNDQAPEEREERADGGGQEGGSEQPERDGDEPRTKPINQERPNDKDGVVSNGVGGGIGATTDGGGDNDDSEQDELPRRKVPNLSGAEFDKDAGDETGSGVGGVTGGAGVAGSSTGSGGGSPDDDSENDQRRPFGSSPMNSGGSSAARGDSELDLARKGGVDLTGGGASVASADAGVEMDVDYRDEMAEAERKTKSAGNGDDRDSGEDDNQKRTTPNVKRHEKGGCDDGSYDHFAHHGHHESAKWLRDAIPGEPGEDYPTLSRVNSTSFDCAKKKLPGYYADVESRCQVFHICQADGRQDSFLCPNGTIFSQLTSVCVLWNSFDCEDAPKYYHLNALLYKPPVSKGGEANLRPLSGAREEEGSAIDSLLRAMRRQHTSQADAIEMMGVTYDSANGARRESIATNNNIGPENEATIQRKSVGSLDGSSRLRSKAEPRRKRRAIVKHVPPKLQSRRISKLSRRARTKLRLKPKRRA